MKHLMEMETFSKTDSPGLAVPEDIDISGVPAACTTPANREVQTARASNKHTNLFMLPLLSKRHLSKHRHHQYSQSITTGSITGTIPFAVIA